MSSRHNDKSSSSRDQDHTKNNSKHQTGMSSKNNDQSSTSRDKDYKKYNSKSQMESEKYKAQSPKPANKPIAFVSPQKRDDIKPMFPKPSSRRY